MVEGKDSLTPRAEAPVPKRQEMHCPQCNAAVPFELVARFANQSRIAIKLTPAPGEYMQASTIGGSLTQMQKLLEASGRHLGIPTVVCVESIKDDGNGTFEFGLLVMRYEDAKKRKKRARAKQPSDTRGVSEP
jgi:hypothetical protein